MSEEMRELNLDELEMAAGGAKIRLLQDLPGKGRAGDVLEVSDGYANNYLIPKGLAEIATPESLAAEKSKDLAAEFAKRKEEEHRKICPFCMQEWEFRTFRKPKTDRTLKCIRVR